jgi:hypothetical protein
VFGQARAAATAAGDAGAEGASDEPLESEVGGGVFPSFTSPSWELEVYWQVNWLQLLGSGVVQQSLPPSAGLLTVPSPLPPPPGQSPSCRHRRKNRQGLRCRPQPSSHSPIRNPGHVAPPTYPNFQCELGELGKTFRYRQPTGISWLSSQDMKIQRETWRAMDFAQDRSRSSTDHQPRSSYHNRNSCSLCIILLIALRPLLRH